MVKWGAGKYNIQEIYRASIINIVTVVVGGVEAFILWLPRLKLYYVVDH